jgi:hypothetical protein
MRHLSEQGVNRASRSVIHGSTPYFHRGKNIFGYKYIYACRIASRLIKIAHFLEILEVRRTVSFVDAGWRVQTACGMARDRLAREWPSNVRHSAHTRRGGDVRNICRKVKNNIHESLSLASVDKSVHKVARPLQYLEFLYPNTALPKN